MIIERKSIISGISHTRDLDISDAQIERYNSGGLAQNVFPNLSANDREFIISGITDEEWKTMESPDTFFDEDSYLDDEQYDPDEDRVPTIL